MTLALSLGLITDFTFEKFQAAGERAQQLNALAALPEGPGSNPSTHMTIYYSAAPVPGDTASSVMDFSLGHQLT